MDYILWINSMSKYIDIYITIIDIKTYNLQTSNIMIYIFFTHKILWILYKYTTNI